jgi:hypothetical protein
MRAPKLSVYRTVFMPKIRELDGFRGRFPAQNTWLTHESFCLITSFFIRTLDLSAARLQQRAPGGAREELQVENLSLGGNFDFGVLQLRGEFMHHILFPVNQESPRRTDLPLPGQKLGLVGMG